MTSLDIIQKASEGLASAKMDWRKRKGLALPPDLLNQVPRMLGVLTWAYALCYAVSYFGSWLLNMNDWPTENFFTDWHTLAATGAIAMSLVFFGLSRSGKIKPEAKLDLGLLFLILGSAGISIPVFYGIFPEGSMSDIAGRTYVGVPWTAMWILIFAAFIPNCPLKIFMASLVAATIGPVTTSISLATGATSAELSHSFFWRYFLLTNYLVCLLAWFKAAFFHQVGSKLLNARAMGGYKLVTRLGAGGMGEVWRAQHRMLARPSALKLIKPEILGSDPEARRLALARFEREAQATAVLTSPHTVRIFDFGCTPENSFYYSMELLDGIGLDSLVERFGPQKPSRVVFLLRQICHSLADAHALGLVHRDIKPSNIFLCRQGLDHDFVKVMDFGLVKSTEPTGQGDLNLTNPNITAGTPGFLSPEMALSRQDLDGRSDLYSLGCVAYWLLTGVPVFQGANAVETAAMHLKDEPIPPSRRSEFPIPDEKEKLILHLLAKEPKDRPGSAQEVDAALASCCRDEIWTGDDASKWWDMHRPTGQQKG
jgi:hypothetical protein